MEKTLIEKIESHAIAFLKERRADSVQTAVLLPELVAYFKKIEPDVKESTLSAYLSKLTRTESSPIRSPGKKQGFYCLDKLKTDQVADNQSNLAPLYIEEFSGEGHSQSSPLAEASTNTNSSWKAGSTLQSGSSAQEQEQEIGETQGSQVSQRLKLEKKLYQIALDWLVAEGFNAEITGERTGNGKWGNPDVTGIKVHNTASETKEVEIATVEVKINQSNWRQLIFEAVSHTRFSNLTYYCFAYPESDRNSFDSEFYMYAEEFGLGLLGIEMEDTDFENYISNKYEPTTGDIVVVELNTPRFRSLRPHFREKFLYTLGIRSLSDLIRWPTLNSFRNTG